MLEPLLAIHLLFALSNQDPTQSPEPTPASEEREWTWGPRRRSSALGALHDEFRQALDEAGQDQRDRVVGRYWPRFLELALEGDPDAKCWLMDNVDWDLVAEDDELAQQLFGWFEDILRDHDDGHRPGVLVWPVSLFWSLPDWQDRLVSRVELYLAQSTNAEGRAGLAEDVAEELFFSPRDARDQERTAVLFRIARDDAQNPEQKARAERSLEVLARQRIGKPCPEVTGTDVEGKPLALSAQRGKVVILEFWGFW